MKQNTGCLFIGIAVLCAIFIGFAIISEGSKAIADEYTSDPGHFTFGVLLVGIVAVFIGWRILKDK